MEFWVEYDGDVALWIVSWNKAKHVTACALDCVCSVSGLEVEHSSPSSSDVRDLPPRPLYAVMMCLGTAASLRLCSERWTSCVLCETLVVFTAVKIQVAGFWVVTPCGRIPTFRRNLLPPVSGWKQHVCSDEIVYSSQNISWACVLAWIINEWGLWSDLFRGWHQI